MNQIILLAFVSLAISAIGVAGQAKLHIGIYYESLCPDSIRFLKNQLEPVYHHFDQFVDIEFVPFGKSRGLQTGHSIEFSCQHGPDECSGNKIHSCALILSETQRKQVEFVTCQMSYGAESSDVCAEQAGIAYDNLLECYSSEHSTKLQLIAETQTKQIAAPRDMLAFVPTIVYNHKFDQAKQNRSLLEFQSVVCEELQRISNEIPAICDQV